MVNAVILVERVLTEPADNPPRRRTINTRYVIDSIWEINNTEIPKPEPERAVKR